MAHYASVRESRRGHYTDDGFRWKYSQYLEQRENQERNRTNEYNTEQ